MPPVSPGSADSSATAPSGFSRRSFLRRLGTGAVSAATLGATSVAQGLAEANAERIQGPNAVPVTLSVNGRSVTLSLEPRVTLLEALRQHAGLTGAKEACDRSTCGACTVLKDGLPVYACSLLAIEAQGCEITTIEGLGSEGEMTELQKAFAAHDGLQCGFCSPGMVMTLTALLRRNPRPSEIEIRRACAGNLCRCGSYPRIFAATLAASGQAAPSRVTLVPAHTHGLA